MSYSNLPDTPRALQEGKNLDSAKIFDKHRMYAFRSHRTASQLP